MLEREDYMSQGAFSLQVLADDEAEVLVKFAFMERPLRAKVVEREAAGLWFEGKSLANAMTKLAVDQRFAPTPDSGDISGESDLFVPFQQIVWLIAAV